MMAYSKIGDALSLILEGKQCFPLFVRSCRLPLRHISDRHMSDVGSDAAFLLVNPKCSILLPVS